MRIDESPENPAPRQLESLNTTGVIGQMPPSGAKLTDLGPLGDTATMTPREVADPGNVLDPNERSLSPLQAGLRRLARNRRALVSLAIILIMLLISFIGPLIYVHIGPVIQGGVTGTAKVPPTVYHVYTHQELIHTDESSSAAYPLGTDRLGRDILARLMAGVTVSIEVTLVVIALDIGLGLLIGTLAGFYGGWIDTFLARFTDVMFAFPGLLFLILAAATLGPAFADRFGPPGRLILVSLAIGITIWPQMARYVRGNTLQLKEQQYIEAARTVGGTNRSIILRHIVPNLLSIVIAAATLDIVGTIIGEATVSLLGLGVQAPGSSLGLMISTGAQALTFQASEVLWPTITLAILVICFAFVGDGVNEAFDPRSKD